ncbi:MAG: peptidoglycan DD-metalloendopeptidase family protein [Defluviitaleaceae bacterium]|nr:peptidoglycan DD-metalloendopeptidase family protein [Defluviitaleaceae bacterium]MCL2240827.1 peptidoglycan DD-metalloendopeptidase family protein [Defluviitaleaceae bacterium]
MFFKKDPSPAPRQNPPIKARKASEIINASGSHKQKKYLSIMLVPSYTTGKTRSLRVPRAVFYCVLISLFVVSAVIAGLQIRATYAMRMAQDYSTRLTLTEEEFDSFMDQSEDELNEWIAAHVDITDTLEAERWRAQWQENQLKREHNNSLEDLQDRINDLQQQIIEFDEGLSAAIAGLSRRAFIPPVANLLEQLNAAQDEIRATHAQNGYYNGYYENGYYANGQVVSALSASAHFEGGAGFLGATNPLALPPPVTEEDLIAQIEEHLQTLSLLNELKDSFQSYRTRIDPYERNHPTLWPVRAGISSPFGNRRDPFGSGAWQFHSGIDIAAPVGTSIRAAGGGTVTFSGWTSTGLGIVVIIDHGFGIQTLYAHNSVNLVRVGQRVERGDVIARVGTTGSTTGPHVHYEVHINGRAVNPRNFLLE